VAVSPANKVKAGSKLASIASNAVMRGFVFMAAILLNWRQTPELIVLVLTLIFSMRGTKPPHVASRTTAGLRRGLQPQRQRRLVPAAGQALGNISSDKA
jgi:hypothetical protein